MIGKISPAFVLAILFIVVGILGSSGTARSSNDVVGSPVGAEYTCPGNNCVLLGADGEPIGTTVQTSTGTGGFKTSTRTEVATSVRTRTETTAGSRTRTETATHTESTSTSTRQATESPGGGASELYNIGTSALYSGVEKIAVGITMLSQSSSPDPSTTASQEALQLIGSGNHDVETGQASIRQGQAVEENSRRLGAVNGSPPRVARQPFDFDHAPLSTQESLSKMEKEAAVSPGDLLSAAAAGNTEAVYDLASSAKGVSLSGAEIAAGIPVYKVSSMPSTPTLDPLPESATARAAAPAGTKEKSTRAASASAGADHKHTQTHAATADGDPLAPLERDQFLSSLTDGTKGNASLGNPNVSLFQRVRAQYVKRRPR